MSKNRFAGINPAKRVDEGKKEAAEQTEPIAAAWSEFADQTQKKLGRPPGKRSNAEFRQVTAYVRRDTYRKVQRALFDGETDQDFSDLVEMLLVKYLDEQ